jgi:Protein of unknown function (DUF3592)
MKVIATPKYVFTLVKYVFILVGIGLLVGAFSMYKNTSSFVTEASRAEGTVVDFQMSRRGRTYSPMSRRGRTYSPIIHFISQEGKKVEFISSVGTNPPSYSKGQKVEVLYQPTEPQNAKINGFSSLWASSVILGGLGGLFFMIGTSISLVGALKNRKDEYLKKDGIPIETEFQSVEFNTSLSANGKHPFIITTQWQNPSTSELHIFQSNNLWFDPSDYIKSERITVFIERNNPKKYYVDLSFLPKLAK